MKSISGSIRQAVFGLPLEQVEGAYRGFRSGSETTTERLNRAAKCVVHAYNLGLETSDPEQLCFLLELVEPEMRGFAYEGGAMGMVVADMSGFGSDRLSRYIAGPGKDHSYMAHVGAGLALGIFKRDPLAYMQKLDPFLRWLVLNGYGFCHGFFDTEATVRKQRVPKAMSGEALSAYDAGLGRALWFVDAGQPQALAQTVGGFPAQRRPGLWSGIGLACAYASGVDLQQIVALGREAGELHASLGEGVIMAAHTRHVAGNPAPHVEAACQAVCGFGAEEAHEIALHEMADLRGLDRVGESSAWELWLSRLREHVPAHGQVHGPAQA